MWRGSGEAKKTRECVWFKNEIKVVQTTLEKMDHVIRISQIYNDIYFIILTMKWQVGQYDRIELTA